MKIKDYLNYLPPFSPIPPYTEKIFPFATQNDMINNTNYFMFSEDFQDKLKRYMRVYCGDFEFRDYDDDLANMSHEDAVNTALWLQDMIATECGDIYILNKYKYKTLKKTEEFEYDPIENYNRIEHWNDTGNGTETSNETLTKGENETINGIESSDSAGSETIENKTSPENNSNYYGTDKVEKTNSDNSNGSSNKTRDLTGTEGKTASLINTNANTRDGYAKGNIGTTTTQQMISEERRIAEFNFIKIVAFDIVNHFCYITKRWQDI